MGRRKKTAAASERKKKPVLLKWLKREHKGQLSGPYQVLDRVIEKHFTYLVDANIKIAWNMAAPREDADGQVAMYRVRKGSDLDRNEFDFVVILSHEIWNKRLGEQEMEAVMHEALCSCARVVDKDGEQKIDEDNRLVWRIRKPDVRTFRENVARYGLWRPEVDKLVQSAAEFNDTHKRPLLNGLKEPGTNGHHKKRGPRFSEPATSAKDLQPENEILKRAKELKTRKKGSLECKADQKAYDSGGESFRKGWKLEDCPYAPGDQRDDFIRGWLSEELLAKV